MSQNIPAMTQIDQDRATQQESDNVLGVCVAVYAQKTRIVRVRKVFIKYICLCKLTICFLVLIHTAFFTSVPLCKDLM